MKHFFSFLLLVIFQITYCQKEANIWYFGTNAGVDFNSGAPVALTDGAMNTVEGCTSIADKSGNLLFYTDGIKVWNKLHVVMPNGSGLKGDPSSTQSGIIVPKPGSTTQYYIFTVPCCGGGISDGLRYSEVDITLDGGKGDIILGTKNTLLISSVDEKVTAVLHSNKKDIWVVSAAATSNTYYSYLVTALGIDPVIISIAGSPKSTASWGYLKSSPNGKYFVDAEYFPSRADVLNFNNTTGLVTTWFGMPFVSRPYGAEFSPDNSRLYIAELSGDIYQFDMTSGVSASIVASKIKIGSATGSAAAMQLGPDKKIYISKSGKSFLGCIHDPNNLGLGCSFTDDAISLAGRVCQLGLPNFIQSFFSVSPFTYTNVCRENPTSFLIQDSIFPSGIVWNFGDPSSGATNTSLYFGPKHTFSSIGTYTVKAIVSATCCPNDTLTQVITISEKPSIALRNDTTLCAGISLNLSVANSYTNYLWSNGSTSNAITAAGEGTYWVKVTNECGFVSDTIHISTMDKPVFALRNDTSICDGMTLDLKISSTTYSVSNYLWSNSTTSSSITINNASKYWAKASNQCGFTTDTFNLNVLYKPVIALRNDTVNCEKKEIVLSVANTYTNYLWNTGATISSIITSEEEGIFWVRVTNICGPVSDTVYIRSCGIVIPNVITINGDGINDVFKIKNLKQSLGDLTILNRWGNPIYESKGYNNDWSPKDVNDGVYYYIMNYPPDNKTYTGFISIFNGK